MYRKRELFNILVSKMRLRYKVLLNKGNIMRYFDIVYIVLVSNQVNSIRKEVVAQKLSLKTMIPYILLEKDTSDSRWLQCLTFCEGLVRTGIKLKG